MAMSTKLSLRSANRPALASPLRRRAVPVIRAQGGDKKPTDWDSAWARFQKQVQSQVETPNVTRTPAPRRQVRSVQQDQIRKQERFLLDLWTSEQFYKFGAIGACAGLLLFAVFIGPPPSDGRCTLPWC